MELEKEERREQNVKGYAVNTPGGLFRNSHFEIRCFKCYCTIPK